MNRKLLAASVAALLVMPVSAMALDCAEGTRPFVHFTGETCIPEAPTRIVAGRHDNIATPLMDIGAPVVGTTMGVMEDGSQYVRGASDIFGQAFVDNYGLTSIGTGEVDLETIAALEPDLIILTEWQVEVAEQAGKIAPTIVLAANLPFFEHLEFLADAAGMKGAYEQRRTAYDAKIAATKALIGDPSGISISRLDMAEGGLWFYPNWGAIDRVIQDLGFARPAVQAEATENMTEVSFERIEDFDADILISSRALRFGQTVDSFVAQWDTLAPFWRNLAGVQAGNHYWYDRDVWVGYTFKSLEAVTDALLLLSAGRFDQPPAD